MKRISRSDISYLDRGGEDNCLLVFRALEVNSLCTLPDKGVVQQIFKSSLSFLFTCCIFISRERDFYYVSPLFTMDSVSETKLILLIRIKVATTVDSLQ